MILSLLQATVDSHDKELIGLGALFLTTIGGMVSAHFKGRGRDASAANRWKRVEDGIEHISSSMATITVEVRDLRSFVVGPDGKNGLRSDVQELTTDVKELRKDVTGILVREGKGVEPSEVGRYDQRVG